MQIICSYTRSQAIEDGVLVDVTDTAKEAGFKFPVALTSAVYDRYVAVPCGDTFQSETGRLWDVLWMLFVAIRTKGCPGDRISYTLCVRNPGSVHDNERLELGDRIVTLKAVIGPGDTMEPVITIMLPHES